VRRWLLVLALAAAAYPAAGQELKPLVRAKVAPANGIVVGQTVRLSVEVLAPNYFTSSPDFPEFELKNAIVVLSAEPAQNFSEKNGGIFYAGIRRAYLIYPEQAGSYTLPPAQIGVSFADKPPHSMKADGSLPALTFRASIPAAAQGLDYFLPTTRLSVQQRWRSPLTDVRVGDTLDRTITITADKLQGMLIPQLTLDAPQGIRVYLEQPDVEDQKTDRGEFLGGRRVETVKYLIEKPGDYVLPSVELTWWDLTSQRLRKETLPEVRFSAVANPESATELPPPVEAPQPVANTVRPWRKYAHLIRIGWPWAVGAFLLIWLLWRNVPRAIRWLSARRREYRGSERAQFRELIRDCKRNDPAETYKALLIWMASRGGGDLEDFLAESDDPTLEQEVRALGACLYSGDSQRGWSGSALGEALKKQRRFRVLRAERQVSLPPLNPAR
jgi:BatD DUF11 like domain